MCWKMVHNFLGIDEKTKRKLLTFDQPEYQCSVIEHPCNVFNKNHVTTHPEDAISEVKGVCFSITYP